MVKVPQVKERLFLTLQISKQTPQYLDLKTVIFCNLREYGAAKNFLVGSTAND